MASFSIAHAFPASSCKNIFASTRQSEAALSAAEVASLRGYTGGNYLYINGVLRGLSPKQIAKNARLQRRSLEQIKKDISEVVSGLRKIPAEKRRLFRYLDVAYSNRGVDVIELNEFYQKHQVGSIVSDPAFVSATSLSNPRKTHFVARITHRFEIDALSARSISQYSQEPNENEFILLPGSRFQVISIKSGFLKTADTIYDRDYWRSFLKAHVEYFGQYSDAEITRFFDRGMQPIIKVKLRELPSF